jgi:hypothetical protein
LAKDYWDCERQHPKVIPGSKEMMMFKTAFLALALMVSAATGYAVQNTGRYGAWTTYAGTSLSGRSMCGASVQERESGFDLKYEGDSLFMHLHSNGWDIPNGTPIKLSMQVDTALDWEIDAVGHKNKEGYSYIEFAFDWNEVAPSGEKYVAEFTNLLKNGLELKIRFPGSEPDWTAQLTCATAALNQMGVCMEVLDGAMSPPTQPFSAKPSPKKTQPF